MLLYQEVDNIGLFVKRKKLPYVTCADSILVSRLTSSKTTTLHDDYLRRNQTRINVNLETITYSKKHFRKCGYTIFTAHQTHKHVTGHCNYSLPLDNHTVRRSWKSELS